MASITSLPPSVSIIIDRIAYWRNQQENSSCNLYIQDCENTISELELIKQLVKAKK